MQSSRPLAVCLILAACAPPAADAPLEESPDARSARGVVEAFNAAVTAEDRDAAMALLAGGSVQFNLHASHGGATEGVPLTQDLTAMWAQVTGLLFNTLESYERTSEVLDVEVYGDLATVWTNTRTVTSPGRGAEPMTLDFSEVWLLMRLDGEWMISGVANNRESTSPDVPSSEPGIG